MKQMIYLVGLGFLALSTAGCSDASKSNSDSSAISAPKEVNTGTLKFAYVNTDSLSMQFQMIKDFEDEILAERMQMENQLQGMVRGLEKDYSDAQQGAAGLSQEALGILQQKLAQKEQIVMQQKNAMENQLLQSEQSKTDQYLEEVQTFLREYAKSEGYDIIYGFNGLNNVLFIDEAYDITSQVVDSLNGVYETKKLQASK